MAIEPPPNIMKAGERPARVRTGAKTATKTQERDMLDKLEFLSQNPSVLVPEWLGEGRGPFQKLERKLERVRGMRGRNRWLRWLARGKKLWNGYAAGFLILEGQKIPSFASMKFRGRDAKFVYRTGTSRHALIGVQHYDDPEARLLGYVPFVKKHKILLVSGERRLVALPRGTEAPVELVTELFATKGVRLTLDPDSARCEHATGTKWRYHYDIPDLRWRIELCLACLPKVGGTVREFLETRVLSPDSKLRVVPSMRGHAFELRPAASVDVYEPLARRAFERALHEAEDKYASYSDVELASWTRAELLKLLGERPEGFLLVGDDLWLTEFARAAETYVDSPLERRALALAFAIEPPKLQASDKSLHKILEPYWKAHGPKILSELAGGLLEEDELSRYARLSPSEALAALARILGARERFKEFLQFDSLPPSLEYLVLCLQVHRSGEHGVLLGKLTGGARDPVTRAITLPVARCLGHQANFEWQYAAHEKEAASFLEPYVRDVVAATPAQFGPALAKLAAALGVPAPIPRSASP